MFNNYNGKYLIVNDKYVGKVISELWSNNCALLKLENYVDHVDMILKNNMSGHKITFMKIINCINSFSTMYTCIIS